LLKPAVAEALVELMAPIITAFEASKEWQEITLKAYPPPEKKKKEKAAETAELPLRETGVQEPTAD
jgi:tyrosyl-tRNA synthetase